MGQRPFGEENGGGQSGPAVTALVLLVPILVDAAPAEMVIWDLAGEMTNPQHTVRTPPALQR